MLIDNKPESNILVAINKESDYQVFVADHIKKVVSTLYSKQINAIILEASFPIFGGYKILEILKRHKRTKNIPLVVLLSTLSEDNIRLYYDCGADLCLGKPVLIEDIILSIDCLLYSKLKYIG